MRVHEYPDGQLAVFWGPHRLADYDATGAIIRQQPQAAQWLSHVADLNLVWNGVRDWTTAQSTLMRRLATAMTAW